VAHFSRTRRAPGGTAAEVAAAAIAAAEMAAAAEPGELPAAAGEQSGDGVIDERAMAEFARELAGSFGADVTAGSGREGGAEPAPGTLAGSA
jgi:hypothetical protein